MTPTRLSSERIRTFSSRDRSSRSLSCRRAFGRERSPLRGASCFPLTAVRVTPAGSRRLQPAPSPIAGKRRLKPAATPFPPTALRSPPQHPSDHPRSLIHERRVDLDQTGAGIEHRSHLFGTGHSAASDDDEATLSPAHDSLHLLQRHREERLSTQAARLGRISTSQTRSGSRRVGGDHAFGPPDACAKGVLQCLRRQIGRQLHHDLKPPPPPPPPTHAQGAPPTPPAERPAPSCTRGGGRPPGPPSRPCRTCVSSRS